MSILTIGTYVLLAVLGALAIIGIMMRKEYMRTLRRIAELPRNTSMTIDHIVYRGLNRYLVLLALFQLKKVKVVEAELRNNLDAKEEAFVASLGFSIWTLQSYRFRVVSGLVLKKRGLSR